MTPTLHAYGPRPSRAAAAVAKALRGVPMLHNGDRLSQPEFHRRYQAMPEDVKAELIGGRVYMASPLSSHHGDPHVRLAGVLALYEGATPGVRASDNATVILADDSEPQPDLHLRLLPEQGGRARPRRGGLLVGPPELVIEIAHSSVAIDLDVKRLDYQRAGVLEYLVLCVGEAELRAFDLKDDLPLAVDADGVFRSKVFPGLWIDAAAALAGDTARVLKVAQKGLASKPHAAFVRKLKAATAAGSPAPAKPRGGRTKRNG